MNLLNEFLFRILVEASTAREVHAPGTVWQSSKGKWSAKRQDGTYQPGFPTKEKALAWLSGQSSADQQEPETERGTSGIVPQTQPSLTTPLTTPEKPSTTASLSSDINDVIITLGDKLKTYITRNRATGRIRVTKKGEVIQKLIVALQTGDVKEIKKVMDEYGIVMGSSGRLKARNLGNSDDFLGTSSDNKDKQAAAQALSDSLFKLLQNLGIGVPKIRVGAEAATTSLTAARLREEFKPTNVFQNQPSKSLPVEINEDDEVVIGNIRMKELTDDQITGQISSIIDTYERSRKENNLPPLSEEEKAKITLVIQGLAEKYNHNISMLRLRAKTGEDKDSLVFEFVGDEGRNLIVAALTTKIQELAKNLNIENNSPEAAVIEELLASLTEMGNAQDEDTFFAAQEKFMKKLNQTDFSGAISSMYEHLLTLEELIPKPGSPRIAYIPTSDSYPTGDVLAINHSSLLGQNVFEQHIATVLDGGVAGISFLVSAKTGNKGNAGVSAPKIQNSSFRGGMVDGVCLDTKSPECAESRNEVNADVKEDLLDLAGMKNEIFPDETAVLPDKVKEKLKRYITHYKNMICAYYGIDPAISVEKLYHMLSSGVQLVCKRPPTEGMVKRQKIGSDYTTGKCGPRFQAWSVLGSIMDAIHNRSIRFQFYDTSCLNTVDGTVTKSDGIMRVARMQHNFQKNLTENGTCDKPEENQNSFSVPSKRSEIGNANPCTQPEATD